MATAIVSTTQQPGKQQANKPGKNRLPEKSCLLLPVAPIPGYLPALELVDRIDEDLTRGVKHYRTKAGKLLETLDQVVVAILIDDLAEPEEVA